MEDLRQRKECQGVPCAAEPAVDERSNGSNTLPYPPSESHSIDLDFDECCETVRVNAISSPRLAPEPVPEAHSIAPVFLSQPDVPAPKNRSLALAITTMVLSTLLCVAAAIGWKVWSHRASPIPRSIAVAAIPHNLTFPSPEPPAPSPAASPQTVAASDLPVESIPPNAASLVIHSSSGGTVYLSGVAFGPTDTPRTGPCRMWFMRVGTQMGTSGLAGVRWLTSGQTVRPQCGNKTEVNARP